MRHNASFSLVLLATATAFLACQSATAHHLDLCADASYKPLCRALVRGVGDARAATESIINHLIQLTNHTKAVATRLGKGPELDTCIENYDDALDDLNKALGFLKVNDRGSVETFVSAAISSYSTCEDSFEEMGEKSPLIKNDRIMEQTADNCLAVYNLVH